MSTFRLQQFSIEQNLSGMKICSDSLLFGAMIPVIGAQRILDIGTGTGILALMQAQKTASVVSSSSAGITSIELTHAAAVEAQHNFNASPWQEKLSLLEQDIQSYSKQYVQPKYDLVICNPPFFDRHTKTQSTQNLRHTARHTDSLSYLDLCQSIERLIANDGNIYLLLPSMALTEFYKIAVRCHLLPISQINIAESKDHSAKVCMVHLQGNKKQTLTALDENMEVKTSTIYKFNSVNQHSAEAKELLAPFLLRYANKDGYTRD
mgnify:CR=1 FL=1